MDRPPRGAERPLRESEKESPQALRSRFVEEIVNSQFERAESITKEAERRRIKLPLKPEVLAFALQKSLLQLNKWNKGEYVTRLLRIADRIGMSLSIEGLAEIAQTAFQERLVAREHNSGEQILSMLRYLTTLRVQIHISEEQLHTLFIMTLIDRNEWASQVIDDVLPHHTISRDKVVKMAYIEALAHGADRPRDGIEDPTFDTQEAAQQALNVTLQRGEAYIANHLLRGDRNRLWNPDTLRVISSDVQQGFLAQLRTGRSHYIDQVREFAERHYLPTRVEKDDLLVGYKAALNRLHRADEPVDAQHMIDMIHAASVNGMDVDPVSVTQAAFNDALSGEGSMDKFRHILALCETNDIRIDTRGPVERYVQYFLDTDNAASAVRIAAFADAHKISFSVEGKTQTALQHAFERLDIDAVCGLAGLIALHGSESDFDEVIASFLKKQIAGATFDTYLFCQKIFTDKRYVDLKRMVERIDLSELRRVMSDPYADEEAVRNGTWILDGIERHWEVSSLKSLANSKSIKHITNIKSEDS